MLRSLVTVVLLCTTTAVSAQAQWINHRSARGTGTRWVIETREFNDKAWLDAFGHPRSEALKVVERLRRRDYGHLDVQVTIDDSVMYSRPFSIRYTLTLTPDTDIIESVCAENERDVAHLIGKLGRQPAHHP